MEITNTPWYVRNHTLHKDLRIPQVRTVLQELTDTHRTALQSHPNPANWTELAHCNLGTSYFVNYLGLLRFSYYIFP